MCINTEGTCEIFTFRMWDFNEQLGASLEGTYFIAIAPNGIYRLRSCGNKFLGMHT